MTTTHTPGPWVENISEDGSMEVWNADYSMFIAKRHPMNDRAEAKANAALIAAAPDLLDELERWSKFAADNGWTDADFHDADRTGWISTTLAAIAKAKGDMNHAHS